MSTYNIYAFVPCDADLCALGTKIYANDAHIFDGGVFLRKVLRWGKRLDFSKGAMQERECAIKRRTVAKDK